ncbi:MAG: hypothetical protein ACKVOQ_10505 [Cyclobacteriaceae bacterium]
MKKFIRIVILALSIVGAITVIEWLVLNNNMGKSKEGVVQKIK